MNCIYRDPNQPIESRIRDLLSRMTLKEKVGQMTQIERRVATPDAIKDLSIGTHSLSLSLFKVSSCLCACMCALVKESSLIFVQ